MSIFHDYDEPDDRDTADRGKFVACDWCGHTFWSYCGRRGDRQRCLDCIHDANRQHRLESATAAEMRKRAS